MHNFRMLTQNQELNLADALRHLVKKKTVSTQEDIKTGLFKMGYEVNQSKISRLLRKIGAVKTADDNGRSVYTLPREPAPLATNSPLANLVLDIKYNENLILIHTSPGSASLLARLLDHNVDKVDILGTVAGDDAILVIPNSIYRIKEISQKISQLLSDF